MHNRYGLLSRSEIDQVRRALQRKHKEDTKIQHFIEDIGADTELTMEELQVIHHAYEEVKERLYYTATLDSLWSEIIEVQHRLSELHVYESLEREFLAFEADEEMADSIDYETATMDDVDLDDGSLPNPQMVKALMKKPASLLVEKEEAPLVIKEKNEVVLKDRGALVKENAMDLVKENLRHLGADFLASFEKKEETSNVPPMTTVAPELAGLGEKEDNESYDLPLSFTKADKKDVKRILKRFKKSAKKWGTIEALANGVLATLDRPLDPDSLLSILAKNKKSKGLIKDDKKGKKKKKIKRCVCGKGKPMEID